MITFGEPEAEELTSAGRRKSGWHKKGAATWKARERKRKQKPKTTRPRMIPTRDETPCPKCYAPMRDGVCTGAWAVANGGHK